MNQEAFRQREISVCLLAMKIGLFGSGKMGKMVSQMATELGHFISNLEEADVYIDFSHASVVADHVQWAVQHEKPIIIGTTGWEREIDEVRERVERGRIAALAAPNFSLGMAYFIQLLRQARTLFSDYEIAGVDYHHSQKKDSPSGTARSIAQALEMTTPFTSVRCGRIPGKHVVIFDSPIDSITFVHEAHNREGFARGALKSAEWILGKKGWYTLDDMLRSLYSAHYPV